jgi:hypothetical protein
MKTYTSVNEFLKENHLDRINEHDKCFRKVVEELDFNTCKKILLNQLEKDGITIERLKEKYNQDEHLNNIYSMGSTNWQWDYIGADMLYNPNAEIRFKIMSDCERTCIAKACASMVVENY